jgi:transposase
MKHTMACVNQTEFKMERRATGRVTPYIKQSWNKKWIVARRSARRSTLIESEIKQIRRTTKRATQHAN